MQGHTSGGPPKNSTLLHAPEPAASGLEKKKAPTYRAAFCDRPTQFPTILREGVPRKRSRFFGDARAVFFSRPRFFVHVVSCEAKAVWRRCNFLVS